MYDLQGNTGFVAKLYNRPVSPEKADKLATMVWNKTERLTRLAAWPVATLHKGIGGPMIGFVMPKASGPKEIHTLYGPKSRLVEFPSAGYTFLVRAASNLARAVAAIHEHGHVIGDVNPGNFLVASDATVRVIDCDSFQIQHGSKRYLCQVGVPTHTPPELQGQSFGGIVRSVNHDGFGLAVLLFQILFLGRHPFSGRYLGRGENTIERAISEHRFAYGPRARSRQMEPPPLSLPFSAVTPRVAQLFERAFSHEGELGGRPSPADWISALGELETQMVSCRSNPAHSYLRGQRACPLCGLEVAGAQLFNVARTAARQPASTLSLEALWRQIEAVNSPGPAPGLPNATTYNVEPLPEAIALGARLRVRRICTWSLSALITFVLFTVLEPEVARWGALAAVVLAAGSLRVGRANSERIVIESRFKAAASHYELLARRWKEQAGEARFQHKMKELTAAKGELARLAATRQKKIDELRRNLRKHELRRFLNSHRIADAKLKAIGAGRKATLQSFGIETAADVSYAAVIRVPGFGPGLAETLVDWRHWIEQGFTFDPNKDIDPRDIVAVDRELSGQRANSERVLIAGPGDLARLQQEALLCRKTMTPVATEAARKLAQARADRRCVRW